jgi:hypothetical protein
MSDRYEDGKDFGEREANGSAGFLESMGADIASPFCDPDWNEGRQDGWEEGNK